MTTLIIIGVIFITIALFVLAYGLFGYSAMLDDIDNTGSPEPQNDIKKLT